MFCQKDSAIVIAIFVFILGLALSAIVVQKRNNLELLTVDDYNLAISVIFFWLLSLVVISVQDMKMMVPYFALSLLNIVTAALVMTASNGVVDNNLNNIAMATIVSNVLGFSLVSMKFKEMSAFRYTSMSRFKSSPLSSIMDFINEGLFKPIVR